MRGIKRHWIKILMVIVIIFAVAPFCISAVVKGVGSQTIVEGEAAPQVDALLILGARVYASGNLSIMLRDRLDVGYDLFKQGKAAKIIVSGDHGTTGYDEVNTMKDYLKAKGIPSEDIFMDHAGFNTYNSIYRARDIFQVKKVIIVTQEYHLMRALFIARELGLEAYGVPADQHIYYPAVIFRNEAREIAARNKDFFMARFIQPKPIYLGDAIPVTGDGRSTDDKRD